MARKIIITTLILTAWFADAGAEIYLWPMHGQRRITSSFSEYRDGHYHAGIDLRSFGAIGLPCLAVCDGHATRMRIGPGGYGKALYLRLSDGRTAVYAHLESFGSQLDSIAWHYRAGKGVSWCDLNLPEGRYAFATGDTVCYSGTSGTTAPHLHFELRDEKGRPFNPLDGIFSIPDSEVPIISGIQVIPASEGSIAGGVRSARVFLLKAAGSGAFTLPDTLHLEGSFYFGISAWDEQGFGRYTMAPLEVALFIDGAPLYKARNTLFSYDQSDEIVREYDLLGSGASGRYLQMYRKEGISRRDREGEGLVRPAEAAGAGMPLEKGIHRGEVICSDASGNESRAIFYFKLHRLPFITESRRLEAAAEVVLAGMDPDGGPVVGEVHESLDGGNTWNKAAVERSGLYFKAPVSGKAETLYRVVIRDDEGAETVRTFASASRQADPDRLFFEIGARPASGGVAVEVRTDQFLSGTPVLMALGPLGADTIPLFETGDRIYSATIGLERICSGWNVFTASGIDYRGYAGEAAKGYDICRMKTAGAVELSFSDTLRGVLESPSVIGEIPCILKIVPAPGPLPSGLSAKSNPFVLDFPSDRLNKPLKLVCNPGSKTALFRWDEEKGWRCEGVPAMEEGAVTLNRPGLFIFMSDGLPPLIRHAALEAAPSGAGFFKPYICRVPVSEDGSGIDPWSAEVFLNGKRFVGEWDEYRGLLDIPIPASTNAGLATLRVEISDRCGNRAVEEFGFMLE